MQPCIGLVELIERGEISNDSTKRLIHSYLLPLKKNGVDVIVLGCTHYVFIKEIIEDYFSGTVTVIDTGLAVALHAERTLKGGSVSSSSELPESSLIYSSSTGIKKSIALLAPNIKNKLLFSNTFID